MSSVQARRTYWAQKLEDRNAHIGAVPNAVHRAIADFDRAGFVRLVVTQNVDGLHRVSGISDERIVELHGSNMEIECQSCHTLSDPTPHFERFSSTNQPPVCYCGGFLKPATVSFGQSLKVSNLDRAVRAAEDAELVVALGTTLFVEPAASLPLLAARRGARYIIVNHGKTGHDGLPDVTLRIHGDVTELIPPAAAQVLAHF